MNTGIKTFSVCFAAKWFSISKWIILWAYSVFFFINNHIIIILCNCYESDEHVFYCSHPNLNFNKTRHWRQNMFSLIYILPKNKVFRKQVLTPCITKSSPQEKHRFHILSPFFEASIIDIAYVSQGMYM